MSYVLALVVFRGAAAPERLRRPLGRRGSAVVKKVRGLGRRRVSPPPGRGEPAWLKGGVVFVHLQGRFQPVWTKATMTQKKRATTNTIEKFNERYDSPAMCIETLWCISCHFVVRPAEGRIYPAITLPCVGVWFIEGREAHASFGEGGPELGRPSLCLPLVQAPQPFVLDRAGPDSSNIGELEVQHPSHLGGLTYADG